MNDTTDLSLGSVPVDRSATCSTRPPRSPHPAWEDARNDLLLTCGPPGFRRGLPFRKSYLAAASLFWEDLFEGELIGGEAAERTADGKLAVIPLADDDDERAVELFLLYAHPRSVHPELARFDELQMVCAQADKWQAPGVAHAALERAHRFPSHVPGLFALAVLHDSAVVAADMLGLFDGGAPVFRFAKVERDAPYVYTRPAWRLADIPASLGIQMMERQAALSWTLLQIESAIFDPECSQVKSWAPLARDLKATPGLLEHSGDNLALWLDEQYQ